MLIGNLVGRATGQLYKLQMAKLAKTIPYGKYTYGPKPQVLAACPEYAKYAIQGSKIGSYCSIAEGLKFSFLGKHKYDNISTYAFSAFYDKWQVDWPPYWKKGKANYSLFKPNPVIVENDVWIATNVTIKEGVTVHNGAVIAFNSLVTKDVPPYALVGGSPAKVIKYRFLPEQIEKLQKISWWNWPCEKVKTAIPILLSGSIEELEKFSKQFDS